VKTLIGFALGTLLSLGTVTSVAAGATTGAAPARFPATGIEVIVVTAKRLQAPPVAAQPIDEFIVIARRATTTDRMPPAMAIEMPKLELVVAEPLVIRL
jgi:hypothetical protein